jgi:hypothetical protein
MAEAKAPTKAQLERRRKTAFNLERQIKAAAQAAYLSWWALAEALYEFHEGGYWSDLGYDSLEEFLAQPEITISRSQFFKQSKTWRDLVVTKQIPPDDLKQLEPTKVREVVPAIMRGEVEPEQALSDAAELSYRDVVRTYRPEENQGRKRNDALDADAEPVMKRCPTCGTVVAEDKIIDGTAREIHGNGEAGN